MKKRGRDKDGFRYRRFFFGKINWRVMSIVDGLNDFKLPCIHPNSSS